MTEIRKAASVTADTDERKSEMTEPRMQSFPLGIRSLYSTTQSVTFAKCEATGLTGYDESCKI